MLAYHVQCGILSDFRSRNFNIVSSTQYWRKETEKITGKAMSGYIHNRLAIVPVQRDNSVLIGMRRETERQHDRVILTTKT